MSKPSYIQFSVANCPVCGKALGDNDWQMSGHVRMPNYFGLEKILYAACVKCFKHNPDLQPGTGSGCWGMWEPRLGIRAEVMWADDAGKISRDEFVTILSGAALEVT